LKESDITKEIIKKLHLMGVFAWKHWGGPMSKRGVSDILGVLPGGLQTRLPGRVIQFPCSDTYKKETNLRHIKRISVNTTGA
jgi:hypothetical protein